MNGVKLLTVDSIDNYNCREPGSGDILGSNRESWEKVQTGEWQERHVK